MRKLGWATVGFTYFLMVWGNLVSSTGSGLGCPDYPLCHGTLTPAISFEVVLEWGHRILAFCASVLIVTTICRILFSSDHNLTLKRSGRSLLALLALQIALGGTTVLLGLSMSVSTIHLLVANFVFSGLITVASVMTWQEKLVVPGSTKVQRLAVAGLGGLVVQLALGALVRHSHSGLACPNFPNCLNGFFPIPFTFETLIAFTHRWWGVLLVGHFIGLAVTAAKRTPALAGPARTVLALGVAQIILGVGTILSGLNTHSRATHAAVGYALWGMLFFVALRAGAFRWLWEAGSSRDAVTDPGAALALTR